MLAKPFLFPRDTFLVRRRSSATFRLGATRHRNPFGWLMAGYWSTADIGDQPRVDTAWLLRVHSPVQRVHSSIPNRFADSSGGFVPRRAACVLASASIRIPPHAARPAPFPH